MILDTNILVRLERELRRGEDGSAVQFLNAQPSGHFYITPTIASEIACGASMAEFDDWHAFLAPFEWLEIDSLTSWHYGQLYQALSKDGLLIGSNDLWIAASGLAHQQAVATGNVNEFRRVKDLDVIEV